MLIRRDPPCFAKAFLTPNCFRSQIAPATTGVAFRYLTMINPTSYHLLRSAALILAAVACQTSALAEKITIAWAKWDPANSLAEISKDFTKETGIEVELDLTPWPDFGAHVKKVQEAKSDALDLIVGDSQWLGNSAESGHYLKLNDPTTERVALGGFVDLTTRYYSEWPKGSKNYWAVPLMGDALGWTFRKDWFVRPQLRKEFKQQYNRELGPPTTWTELLEVAKFFNGREIDGKKVAGAAIFVERASEGMTMGYSAAFYAWGGQYSDPQKPFVVEGFINSKAAIEALEAYRQLYKNYTPPNSPQSYIGENIEYFKSGQVAMMMNWMAVFPSLCSDSAFAPKMGFFVNPSQGAEASPLGGQGISISSYSKKQEAALKFLKWFVRPNVQKKWAASGGFSCHRAVLLAPGFRESTPFATVFLTAMRQVKDFWQEPVYAELLKQSQVRLHDYVVMDKGSAKEALDNLAKDWTKTFQAAGKQ